MSGAASALTPAGGWASGPERPRLRVAVLAGGPSAEHDVSLASAASIRAGLLAAGHDVLAIEIARDGRWLYDGRPLALTPGEGLLGVDVAFPALHGPFGEDGTLQGALEMLGVPYVGAGVATSALCMNKVLFKDLMAAAGMPQVGYVGVSERLWERERERARDAVTALGSPVFVKPARMGSSLGIAKVSDPGELEAAVDAAFAHDDLVIVEAMATGIEVECAILGGGDAARASTPGQIVLRGEWYDFDSKYRPGGMELVVPAPLPEAVSDRVRSLALAVFARVGCEDLARVDFFVDGETVIVNELNTMPGFTPTSVYAKLWERSGVPYSELVETLCRLALERHGRRAGSAAS